MTTATATQTLEKSRRQAEADYAALISKGALSTGEQARLKEVAGELDLSPADVSAHETAVRQARAAEQSVVPAEEVQALSRAQAEAVQALEAAQAAWREQERQLRSALADAALRYRSALDQNGRAHETVSRLRRQYPRAFGLPASAPAATTITATHDRSRPGIYPAQAGLGTGAM